MTILAQVLALIQALRDAQGTAALLITHNLGVVGQICDRVGVLYRGKLHEVATTDTLFETFRHSAVVCALSLTATGAMAQDIDKAMQICVGDRLSIAVSGGTSTGKMTFAQALLAMVAADERIVTIEGTYKLFPPQQY